MLSTTARRAIAIVALSGSLLAGASLAPAAASPAEEAVYLSAMQEAWKGLPRASQRTTCFAYRAAPKVLITKSVTAAREDSTTREALSKAALRRVITSYLAWACAGPGTTPR